MRNCDLRRNHRSPGRLRIALLASTRYPIAQPFAGGLEAHTWQLARGLTQRGHEVCVFAGPGSDPRLHVHESPALPRLSDAARRDVSMPPEYFLHEHAGFLRLMLDLAEDRSYDLVHNNSLHYLPVAMAPSLPVPLLTTLHTPPTPWLETAIAMGRHDGHFVAVSRAMAAQWSPIVPSLRVVRNGIDLEHWRCGPGGGTPVWAGRLVPEKGAHLAIAAARRAGTGLRIAGPRPDRTWFRTVLEPMLGDGVDYLGHLDHDELATLVGSAAVSVASPCWDEPFGLVVAESLACGTPVAGFARGALPELVTDGCGHLAAPGDVVELAEAIVAASALDRHAVRRSAEQTCSVDAMVDAYEDLYERVIR